MRGLLVRLSNLDPDVSASLRVIEYFDRLVQNSASLEALTRATAALGCCTAGLRDHVSGQVIRFDGAGQASPPLVESILIEAPVMMDEVVVGQVWLERTQQEPLDQMLVERMAVTAAARWRPFGGADRADPALVELVIGTVTADQDRTRALRLMGMSPRRPLRAVAICAGPTVPAEAVDAVVDAVVEATSITGGMARTSRLGTTVAILAQTPGDLQEALTVQRIAPVSGIRIGIGRGLPPSQAAEAWATAQIAQRFASALRRRGPIVRYDDLGAIASLASVPREAALADADVQALARLGRTDTGRRDIDVFLAVTWHGSARQAANVLHLHHSSVAHRLRHIETALGVQLSEPTGHLRAQIAAILLRLMD